MQKPEKRRFLQDVFLLGISAKQDIPSENRLFSRFFGRDILFVLFIFFFLSKFRKRLPLRDLQIDAGRVGLSLDEAVILARKDGI